MRGSGLGSQVSGSGFGETGRDVLAVRTMVEPAVRATGRLLKRTSMPLCSISPATTCPPEERVNISIHLSIYICVYISISISIYLSIYMYVYTIHTHTCTAAPPRITIGPITPGSRRALEEDVDAPLLDQPRHHLWGERCQWRCGPGGTPRPCRRQLSGG